MKILFMSQFGEGLGLACKMADEGNEIFFWIKWPKYQAKGKGFKNIKRIPDYKPYLNGIDMILFDMSGIGDLADKLRREGYPVGWGGSFHDKLEADRGFAQRLIKKHTEADTLIFKEFTNINEGIKYLQEAEESYVFKPIGKDSGTNLTFVPRHEGNEALISFMQWIPSKPKSFILQEKVDNCIEISTEGFFNGNDWVGGFNHTIERKREMENNTGSNCGCMGNIVWPCGIDNIVKTMMLPLTEILRQQKYVGSIDVNAMVNEEEIFFLEFTPRMGYDSTQAFAQLMTDKAQFYKSVIDKEYPENVKDEFGLSVRLCVPPYPYSESKPEEAKDFEWIKVVNVPKSFEHNYWHWDTLYGDNEYRVAGTDGIVGQVAVTGVDLCSIKREAYQIIDKITIINDVKYRNDIGQDTDKLERLLQWGWIDGYPRKENEMESPILLTKKK